MSMGPESTSGYGTTVPAVPDNVAPIRHAVVALAGRLGAPEEVRTDIALAVGEACANVVVHAYPPGDVGPLVVHAESNTRAMLTGMLRGLGFRRIVIRFTPPPA